MRILIADPDQDLTASVRHWGAVTRQVRVVHSGHNALKDLKAWHPDVAVIGADLPDMDAIELLREVRASSGTVAVLLAERTAEDELVRALEIGADAFVSKPVSPRVLHASIDAVLRRVPHRVSAASQPLKRGALTLDPAWHATSWSERPIQLTRQQFHIIHLLARSAGNLVSYRQLMEAIGDASPTKEVAPFTVHVARLVNHIARIRAKLVAAGAPSDVIVAVRGRGYRLRV